MLFQKCKSVVLDADVLPRKRLRNACQILRKLGEGGQGAMYLAQHRRVGAKRCVKFYPKGAPNAPIEDILFEFEVMKTLDSPHVARTYEIFQDASQNSLNNMHMFHLAGICSLPWFCGFSFIRKCCFPTGLQGPLQVGKMFNPPYSIHHSILLSQRSQPTCHMPWTTGGLRLIH